MSVFSFLVAAGFEPMYFSLGSEHLIHYPILTPQDSGDINGTLFYLEHSHSLDVLMILNSVYSNMTNDILFSTIMQI